MESNNIREFDIVGQRYGHLVVVSFDHYEKGASYWLCRCDCGGEKIVSRKFLQNGHTKSCGCLKGGNRDHHSTNPRNLTEQEKNWLIAHFKHTKNDEICEKLNISGSFLHRFAQGNGLKKSPQFMHKAQRAATDAATESHKRNGTFPKKGYRIPRAEEFRFKTGHKETKAHIRKRIEKAHVKRNETIKLERARLSFGIEQKTKMHLTRQNKNVASLRHKLRKRGYIIERGSMVAYYDQNTDRSLAIENRRFGDRNYVAFRFVAL